MIFTGSREWAVDRTGAHWEISPDMVQHEANVAAAAVAKLIARHVIGLTGDVTKRDRAVERGPGLVIVQGGASGLDDFVANAARIYASGLRRRGREEFRSAFIEPYLAEGLWLETHPADWDNRPRYLAGPERNQRMLDAGADHVIAFYAYGRPYGPDERGGTNDMVRRAVSAGVPVDIYVADERRWRKP